MPEEFTTENLDKQDILQLLETGLKENQPFARHFADTVMQEIARKVRNLDVRASVIEIDSEAISEEINTHIRKGISKNVDDTVNTVNKGISEASADMQKASSKNAPLNIQSILGQTPEMSMLTSIKYQGIVRNLLDKIQTGMPEEFDLKEVGIGDIFRPPAGSKITNFLPSSIQRYSRWNKFQIDLLDKITKSIPEKGFNFKEVGIGDIFKPPSEGGVTDFLSSSIGRYRRCNTLQNTLLDKITESLKDGVSFSGGVTLNQIMGVTPRMGIINRLRWKGLQSKIIDNIGKSVKDASKLVPGIKKVDTSKLVPGIKRAIPGGLAKQSSKKDRKDFKTLEEKMPSVIVNRFGKDAMNQLLGVTGSKGKVEGKEEQGDCADKSSLFEKLAKIGLGILAGSIGIGIASLFSDGPFKGLGKMISRAGIKLGSWMLKHLGKFLPARMLKVGATLLKTMKTLIPDFLTSFGKNFQKSIRKAFISLSRGAASTALKLSKGGILKRAFAFIPKMFGKVFAKTALKKLPFGIGALFGLAFGISRLVRGDMAGGLLEFLSGIASIVPGIGTAASVAIDAFLAIRDMKKGKQAEVKPTGTNFFGKLKEKFGGIIKRALPYMPVIGTFIRFKEAKAFFESGNMIKSILSVAGGLATLVPGIGPLLAHGVDMLSSFLTKDKIEEIKEGTGNFLTSIKEKMGAAIIKALPYMPIIGTFIRFKEAKALFGQRKWVEGLLAVGGGLATLVPVVGPLLAGGIDLFSSLFTETKPETLVSTGPKLTIFQAFKKAVYEKIKKGLKNMPRWLQKTLKFVPGLSQMIGDVPEDPAEGFDESLEPQQRGHEYLRERRREEQRLKKEFLRRQEAGEPIAEEEMAALIQQSAQRAKERITRRQKNQLDQQTRAQANVLVKKVEERSPDGVKTGKEILEDTPGMKQLVMKMDDVVKLLSLMLAKEAPVNTNQNPDASIPAGGLSSMGEDQSGIRDPAYVLRSRVWDRLRKGYVVL